MFCIVLFVSQKSSPKIDQIVKVKERSFTCFLFYTRLPSCDILCLKLEFEFGSNSSMVRTSKIMSNIDGRERKNEPLRKNYKECTSSYSSIGLKNQCERTHFNYHLKSNRQHHLKGFLFSSLPVNGMMGRTHVTISE